jgi:hypothetical protein
MGSGAARFSGGDVPDSKHSRLCPLYLRSKTTQFNNQPGHFISALKQSLRTTGITHTPSLKVQHIAKHVLPDGIFQRRRNTVRQKE